MACSFFGSALLLARLHTLCDLFPRPVAFVPLCSPTPIVMARIYSLVVLVAVSLLCSLPLSAQPTSTRRDATIWYFGLNAGVTFASGTPVALTNSRLSTLEGSSVICDRQTGRLLFYTDGVTIWDSTHQQMPNGTNLKGHWTSAQSVLIVPLPEDSNIYYVFTTGAGLYHTSPTPTPNNNGVRYSIVDMRLNGGRGDVTVKNVTLLHQGTEMLTAARHCNGVDYWVIAHDWAASGGSGFRSYHLTPQGITDTTVSKVGTDFTDGFRTQNMAKLSSTGKLMAVTSATRQIFEIYDFDIATGSVSNARLIGTGFNYYSAAFSPDNSKLYTSSLADNNDPNYLYQYNLSSLDAAAIRNSRYEVHKQTGQWQGAQIQLGPDGKIYASWFGQTSLSIINNPNASGVACNYVQNGLSLAGKSTQYGLPNFIDADVFGAQTGTLNVSIALQSSFSQVEPGQTVSLQMIVCNNSSTAISGAMVDVALPAGLTYVSGLNNYPRHTIATLAAGACDTITIQATVNAGQPGGARLTTCASLSTPTTQCLIGSDSGCFDFHVAVPTGPVDYTFYALAACPGVHDTTQVLFNSQGYTDRITGISFSGPYAQFFEYAGPRPIDILITPTRDQYIPVHVRWPGLGNTRITGVMTMTTAAGDTIRIGIESSIGTVTTPVLDIKAIHLGTRSGTVDTCFTIKNTTPRSIRLTDTTWLRGGNMSARVVSPGLPIVLPPSGQATMCIQAMNPSPSTSDTLMLGGIEVWECPHCALATIVVDGQPRPIVAGVTRAGEGTAEVKMSVVPNPVQSDAEVRLELEHASTLRLSIVDAAGVEWMAIAEHIYAAGRSVIAFNVVELPAGIYWISVEGNSVRSLQRMVVMH